MLPVKKCFHKMSWKQSLNFKLINVENDEKKARQMDDFFFKVLRALQQHLFVQAFIIWFVGFPINTTGHDWACKWVTRCPKWVSCSQKSGVFFCDQRSAARLSWTMVPQRRVAKPELTRSYFLSQGLKWCLRRVPGCIFDEDTWSDWT